MYNRPVNIPHYTQLVRDIADFPEPGILFKDITPVLADRRAFTRLIIDLAEPFFGRVDKVAGIEARGFILATPVADELHTGFVPIRKPGKLPWTVVREEYELEYGRDALEIHADAVTPGERVLVVDDVLATGGTAAAAVRLLRHLGAEVVGLAIFIELGFLNGRSALEDVELHTLVNYDGG
ncbi:MAG: adenine phosphoribosyltransferase [Acidimicrobiia bacterium]|nr:adenine phosphoribosyltransferase [Acidimicrobiia bacterium]